VWTREQLQATVKERFQDTLLVVVSNREPYIHTFGEDGVTWRRPASGIVTALDPVMHAVDNGLWVALASGSADRQTADARGCLGVPPDDPSYTLKRVWLPKDILEGYYYGFANEALWPLSHLVYRRPTFRTRDWECYQQANRAFAKAILEEVEGKRAFIWIQDYHFCLLGQYLHEARPDITTGFFWHIPWPNPEIFRICPMKHELLKGLLANDLVGFHIRYHRDNFLATVDMEIECRIDREHIAVVRRGHRTRVRAFPISVDFEAISRDAMSAKVEAIMAEMRDSVALRGSRHIFLGVDRFDYTKGIVERLRAFDRFLEMHPEHKGEIVFLQAGEASRTHIEEYRRLNEEVDALVEEINWKHGTDTWTPVSLLRRSLSYEEVLALYRLASVLVVSSLHDGMNLVSKEFVAARSDLRGVLVISRFTGAARELSDAVSVNPYHTDDFAVQLAKALAMPKSEQARRLTRLRQVVQENNIYTWAASFLAELGDLPVKAG